MNKKEAKHMTKGKIILNHIEVEHCGECPFYFYDGDDHCSITDNDGSDIFRTSQMKYDKCPLNKGLIIVKLKDKKCHQKEIIKTNKETKNNG